MPEGKWESGSTQWDSGSSEWFSEGLDEPGYSSLQEWGTTVRRMGRFCFFLVCLLWS